MEQKRVDIGILIWLGSGCLLIATMVIVGGITRLTHSGLSIVEWNLLLGAIPPMNDTEWQIAFEQYKQFPEYQTLHSHFNLSEFKSIFFWEYLHRLIGRVMGIVFIVPFIYFLIKKRISKILLPKLIFILFLGAFQGFLGWFMVKSGLVDRPSVSHYRLAAHLTTAFGTLAYILWVILGMIQERAKQFTVSPLIRNVTIILFMTIVLQIIYGAFVAGLKAGMIFNTFPKMYGEWIPEAVTTLNPFYLNLFENMAGVQFIHRYLAWIISFGIIALYFIVKSQSNNKQQFTAVRLLLYVILIQFTLGVFTLIYSVPVTLGVLHQFGALLVLSLIVYQLHTCKVKI